MVRKILKKSIHAPEFLSEPIEYNSAFSRGISLNLNRETWIFISGTASIDRKGRTLFQGNFHAQAKRTFDNITALLKSEKADWHDVVQTRCYLKSMRYYLMFNKVRTKFYQKNKLKPFPASVCIEAKLCRPELLIEIELLAVRRL